MTKVVKSRAKQVILSIAIALVLVFFVAYAVSVFYEEPKYEYFCGEEPRIFQEYTLNETLCLEQGGRWTPGAAPIKQPIPEGSVRTLNEGYCDISFECRQEHGDARDLYNRNIFIISSIFGLLIVVLGIVLKLESVSVGIMGGGALLIMYGTMRYWGELGKYFRLAILGFVLAALIFLGYKKFSE